MRTNLSLVVILVAALLLELTMAVMYYSAQNIIEESMESSVDVEMNAIYLCIHNKLAKVEVTVDNMAWVVQDELEHPDHLYVIPKKMVENNHSFLGSGIAFVKDYYKNELRFFEPYAVRRDGRVVSLQLGSDDYDHTKDEYFRVPVYTNEPHWSEPYMDPDGAKTVITTYGVPLHDNKGKKVGIVYADIALDWLEDILNEDRIYASTQRFLINHSGNLLAGEDNSLYKKVKQIIDADGSKDGKDMILDENGEKQHVFYHRVGGKTDWVLISSCSDKEVFGKLRSVRLTLLLLVLAGLIPLTIIVLRARRQMVRLNTLNAEKGRRDTELQVANRIQQSMLPRGDLKVEGLELSGLLVPAREVGGDLFDYFIRDEKLFFCIGDVSGKGAASAMLMAVVHTMFRDFSAHENNPARIMNNINYSACQNNETNMFVTLFLGVLDLPTGHLRYCNAGHDAPFILNTEQKSAVLPTAANLPVGVFEDTKYNLQEVVINTGSTIFLYTDGLTEAKITGKKQFGIDGTQRVLDECAEQGLSPKQILDTVMKKVSKFIGADDLTMLTINYTPQQFETKLDDVLTLKNDVREVKLLGDFMTKVTESLSIEKAMARQLRLAVEEAVVNVIDYAYPVGNEGKIEVRALSDGKSLKVVITDSGVPFDPTEKARADTTLSAEDRQIGGLGILLVRELMDTINYEREGGKNILTLVKKIV